MREARDFKLFGLLLALGLTCAGIGAGTLWLHHAASAQNQARLEWVSAEGQLYEAGIRWSPGKTGANYELTARYELRVGGRNYPGSGIASGHSGKSPDDVKALLVQFAPEAADFSLQDLGPLNPQRSWSVAYRPVQVRYDARDPARSELVLERAIVVATASDWIVRGIAWLFLLAGMALCIFAWPAASAGGKRGPQREVRSGPALAVYPQDERHRIQQAIAIVLAEISRVSASGTTAEMRYYTERIRQMDAAARDGSLVPADYTMLQLGRGADEVFGDGKLVRAASELQKCMDSLAARPSGGPVSPLR